MTLDQLVARARANQATRQAIFDVEADTGHLDHDAIHDAEDEACAIVNALAALADANGNVTAREGLDRCACGCKYWENDRCIDCGRPVGWEDSTPLS